MATIRVCDICGNEIDEPKIIGVDGNEMEVCDEHAGLWNFIWSNDENIKAMFESVKRRKLYQEGKDNA